ncbi:MAG: 7-carboxy-7-deazaguanine synthase QueE [Firmicutes bacterium]|nr:7-carboxy-7-deazaguanine synthase QueE [Bacillota bacterium]MCM1401510.1 7-carboxy-7-deazaguanine synthase QueE [Bacteroides sp.]MCM1477360.1 7-carboxy-7-deazaguanine synthase QueE [Bacteroides sp.]
MKINEIFYSLQGEGHFAGTPAVFVRFAGCNLKCPFCDTNHSAVKEMTCQEILEEINRYEARRVILTGGEPTLQLTAEFINALHRAGYLINVESNGTRKLPAKVDWLVVSPKEGGDVVADDIDELKVVFTGPDYDPAAFLSIPAGEYFLQPCDVGLSEQNRSIVAAAVEYVKRHPQWRLSLQTHKLINIP